ncbi:hypothetical protein GGS23DRAFT_595422 [Durotheca rogersii]|uniref:uncharacterized protein n=1 Tax=Durotheca rogersii TaxID=419775 RepID=UPI0022210A77|nr:uncharacterized protein GGS23DRAFT_595422 [Durotheca rogersii]KAI5864713.1 hypothetical protein GGS23DRAFT_595422 [Durotheca rogersii]
MPLVPMFRAAACAPVRRVGAMIANGARLRFGGIATGRFHGPPRELPRFAAMPFASSSAAAAPAASGASGEESAIDAFFAQFPSFPYDRKGQIMTEFRRLCKHQGWGHDSEEKETALKELRAAIAMEFGTIYGTDPKSLTAWQLLCDTVRISPVPDTVKDCRKKIRGVHVNLVDLVHGGRTDSPVQVFESLEKLRKYSKRGHKIFPLEEAKEEGLLKHLLRKIYAGSRDDDDDDDDDDLDA